jgi:hypothetical protein
VEVSFAGDTVPPDQRLFSYVDRRPIFVVWRQPTLFFGASQALTLQI